MKIIAYLYSDPLLEPTPDANSWGWEVDAVYQDLGARQQLQQLLKDCQQEPADYLLIRRLEELGDSVEEVCDRLKQLNFLNIQLIVTDTEIPQPITLLKLLEQIQSNQHSRRIRQGYARNRIKALPPPGKAPYGYRRGKERYIVDRSTAPVVKDFFEQFLLYGSLRGAVRYIERKYGKKISASTGQRWLINPVYRGDTAYQNNQILSETHTPIISREEAAQIDRLLRRNRRLPPRTASAPRSLAGLVVCKACQSATTIANVTTPRKKREYLYVRPTNCPQKPKCHSIRYDAVLAQTIEKICRDLLPAVAEMNVPSGDSIKQKVTDEISQKQSVLVQLSDLTIAGILDVETAELRAYKLRTEIAVLQEQLSQLPPVNLQVIAQAVSIPQFWIDLSESERRFYFREFIREIEIDFQNQEELKLKLVFIF